MTKVPESPLPRYAPDRAFPPYAYVPGRFPHPTRDPEGHSFGIKPQPAAAPDPKRWFKSKAYLYGVDLFNHGYYWEAHEVWEDLWHACGRRGTTADFLRALIRMAAAGVKAMEEKPEGVQIHANAACELFDEIGDLLGDADPHFLGLQIRDLCRIAKQLGATQSVKGVGLRLSRTEAQDD
ncbi:MAG: DUF309 domain-containing protein [Burkholderiales bacterium]